MPDHRTGIGWDAHRLAPNRPLILGGVRVPSELGLEGHSDADVLSHAITDALLGAAALGDIGMHFPDSDPRWTGADSLVFLRHARDLANAEGFRLVSVDATVILERPKLKDYRMAIRQKLAGALELLLDQVSVKFKTAEGLGPVERAAQPKPTPWSQSSGRAKPTYLRGADRAIPAPAAIPAPMPVSQFGRTPVPISPAAGPKACRCRAPCRTV